MRKLTANPMWIWLSGILLVGLVTYIVIYPPAHTNNQPVAKVNGVNITEQQLYTAMLKGGGQQMLDTLITDELISQEAKKAGVQVTDSDMDEEMSSVKGSFSSDEEFQQALASYGMTIDDLKDNMKSQVMLKKILAPQVTISDDDIKKYYDENLATLKVPEQVKASHITVATKDAADTILADLKKGGDFAAAAQKNSTDASTKDKGGDLGYISAGKMGDAFDKAAFALTAGAISDVVQTDNGYEIIKVSERKQAYTPTLEEKKADIQKSLKNDKISELSSSWMDEKKSAASIENYLTKGA
ncbi:peptidyl-prolyl cis-trans isomerase [Paenibacillus thalictri]|uniref:Foldase n=1 Tax=Paenibacillus thalictri TaxID=2527873 RepID=A0A4Q9DPG7_9BACL|nr:peptidyl-prolyl cis-trans isomerase [Paenibacillus thalictri]TBL76031.1 foldase [Paenibacillus thalictri]